MKYSIAELRAREQAASPREWEDLKDTADPVVGTIRSPNAIITVVNNIETLGLADTAFIADARNDFPDILDLLEEAWEICEQVDTGHGIVATSYVQRARIFLNQLKKE